MTSPVAELRGVGKTYVSSVGAPTEALRDISFSMRAGEIVCVVGKSGCGKSTLLNIMGGSLEPTSGTAIVLGANPRQARRNIGYMRQQAQLIPYRTALQNAALGLEIRAPLTASSRDRVVSLIKEVGLADFQNAFPHELSGGMQQRVALARTLALDSPLVLCDEPFAALDFDTRLEMEEFFWNLIKRNNSACLFVTHDIESAIALGDRVLVLSSRPGRIAREIVLPPDFRTQSPIQSRESSRTADYFKEIWELLRTKPA